MLAFFARHLTQPHVWRIRPCAEALRRGYVRLRIRPGGEAECDVRLPAASGLDLLLSDGRGCVAPAPAEFAFEALGAIRGGVAVARLAFTSLRRAALRFGDIVVFPEGGKRQTRRYRKQVEASRQWGVSLDGALVSAHPELIEGWSDAATPAQAAVGAATRALRIAVALHLYYPELWSEFESMLLRFGGPFALCVSLTPESAALGPRIAGIFPNARVRMVENRGRDVRPFLLMLEEGWFDSCDLVCKIHGKRSLGGGRFAVFGDVMRRAALLDLVADAGRVEAIVGRFATDPRLGLVGPRRFLTASTAERPYDIFGPSRATAERLACDIGSPLTDEVDFFEGTMFWAHPAALEPLRRLGLAERGFAEESGRLDGATEHAVERLFNHAARAAGYTVAAASVD
jgi:hypothetical protein